VDSGNESDFQPVRVTHGWDVTGAAAFGFTTCWVNRSGLPFEDMGQRPTWTVDRVDAIAPMIFS
jgi:FMN phosphatase YigB (HAD superfamily)